MIASIEEPAYDSLPALRRLLAFCGSLRDQYSAVRLILPVDLPLNLWLRESQLPHRRVDHPAASCRVISRMQVRVLDYGRWLQARQWRADAKGKLVLAIAEPEGGMANIAIDVTDGRASVSASQATADLTVTAAQFATIASGATSARTLAAMGVIDAADPRALALLDALNHGPAPFCWEYF